MDATNEFDFARIMDGLAEIYSREVSKAMLGIYFNALCEYDINDIRSAVSRHVKSPDSGQFFPKIADIVKMIEGNSKDAGAIAWTKVDKAVRQVGPYQTVVFDDPIIHRVVSDMGGWIQLGEKTEEEWPFVHNDFVSRYNGYKSRGIIPEHAGKLTGEHEACNSARGFLPPQPVCIGDKEKALIVLDSGSNKPAVEFNRVSDCVKPPNNSPRQIRSWPGDTIPHL